MSTTGTYNDAPYKIINEGRQITITLDKISESQLKISWTLPTNVNNCALPPEAYNGIVVVLDTTDITQTQTPLDNNTYVADPTADINLHVGDKIGSGLVIGAFYNDKTTKSIIVDGIAPSTAYFVAGFAVDNVFRYHREGVHTYSQLYTGKDVGVDTSGYQILKAGVASTDSTGLVATDIYDFSMMIDSVRYNWTFTGPNIVTFGGLLAEIQTKINTITNPYISTTAPNTNGLYFDLVNQKMYKWNGSANIEQPLIVSTSSPNTPLLNSYWLNSTNKTLSIWNGTTWTAITSQVYSHPYNQLVCGDYWFNGTTVYQWNGTIWSPLSTVVSGVDPSLTVGVPCNTYWFDSAHSKLFSWTALLDCNQSTPTAGTWHQVTAILSNTNPITPSIAAFWFNDRTNVLKVWGGAAWVSPSHSVVIQTTTPLPSLSAINSYWFNPSTDVLKQYNGLVWVDLDVVVWGVDPTIAVAGTLWWNTLTDVLSIWDVITANWVPVSNFVMSAVDPSLPVPLPAHTAWINTTTSALNLWDGVKWVMCSYIDEALTPAVVIGDYFFNTITQTFSLWNGVSWNIVSALINETDPSTLSLGDFWYNPSLNIVQMWNGAGWVSVLHSLSSLAPTAGALWYDPTSGIIHQWMNGQWDTILPAAIVVLEPSSGNIVFTSTTKGSASIIIVPDVLDNSPPAVPNAFIPPVANVDPNLFSRTTPKALAYPFVRGTDKINGAPLYKQQDVGTDGSSDERRDLIERVLMSLGYPTIQVELTKAQLDFCVDTALSTFRKYSASAYERAFFFMDFKPGIQHYYLTDKTAGLNKIVRVSSINRKSSSFMSSSQNSGVWGQIVLQQMYQMGTYDLVSYSMMSDYIELLEILFASRVVFRFNERTRRLDIFQNVGAVERVMMDVTLERTEQDLISDRMISKWMLNYSLAEACAILANIRGKFSSLPGAGGSVSLNASDLKAMSTELMEKCYKEIDDYIVSEPEVFGMESSMIIG
jgi:hypothetical protein